MRTDLLHSIKKLEHWIESQNYKGYDPFDGLSSYLHALVRPSLFAERCLQQIIRQSPVNLRPLLGVKPEESPIGRAYVASGYLKMFEITGLQDYIRKANQCLLWLMQNRSPQYADHAWGNSFNYVSRTGRLSKYEPTIVWTSLVGQAFLDAYETLGDHRYLDVAISACRWISELPREKTDRGECLSYVAYGQYSIHNSNMLGAALLARTGRMTKDCHHKQIAQRAMDYSCSRQLSDGAWYYGEAENLRWIDNFHTGYNLASLKCYADNTGDATYDRNMRDGFRFFKSRFFEESGRPKYYHNRLYPIDIQCVSQAIETLVSFAGHDESAVRLALKVAEWAIEHMQDQDGKFFYRLYPLNIKAKTPMIHWGEATTYKSLAVLLSCAEPEMADNQDHATDIAPQINTTGKIRHGLHQTG